MNENFLMAKARPKKAMVQIAIMPRARMQHRIATFENKLYMTGGTADGMTPYLTMIDILDLSDGSWLTPGGTANAGKALHGAFVRPTEADGGYLHIVGGAQTVSGTTGSTGTNTIYRINQQIWTNGPATSSRMGFANVADEELGRFWIFGGSVSGAADLRTTAYFNYATAAWVNVNVTNPRTATGGMDAVLVGDDIYLFGGTVVQTYKFNRTTQQFTQLANMPKVVNRFAAFERNGKIYAVGNTNINDEVFCYDIATDAWSILRGDFGMVSPAAIKVGERIILSGGRTAQANSTTPVFEVFPELWKPY